MMSCSQTRLFVGNLPDNTIQSELQTAFSTFGEVTNIDLKSKSANEDNKKNFAFVTLSSSNYNVESCIKYFSNEDFHGKKLYVTRARESFLERLQRERSEAERRESEKKTEISCKTQPILKLGDQLNPRKRKFEHSDLNGLNQNKKLKVQFGNNSHDLSELSPGDGFENSTSESNKKKQDSDQKRRESMIKKRQEFKEKQKIIKSGLVGIDSLNKKKVFSDNEENVVSQIRTSIKYVKQNVNGQSKSNILLDDDDDSGDEVNFNIKKQFEGKKGQKVLDLQSRYKSDKRFTLDEKFIEDDESEDENQEDHSLMDENIDVGTVDEKAKQLNILQDILGIPIKQQTTEKINNKKKRSKPVMLRFDPGHPEHIKFLAPVEEKPKPTKKTNKKKCKDQQDTETPELPEQKNLAIEVSKEQFYKVCDTLKETIVQPTTFSLRSLFANDEEGADKDESTRQESYIHLEKTKERKTKNPLDPGEKNPFVYDSSDSEPENIDNQPQKDTLPERTKVQSVWKENLFFSDSDYRLTEGLAFFNKSNENEGQKERRELKSVMKKRIYNKERKNQMFQKKIGGRRKMMKKSFRRKS